MELEAWVQCEQCLDLFSIWGEVKDGHFVPTGPHVTGTDGQMFHRCGGLLRVWKIERAEIPVTRVVTTQPDLTTDLITMQELRRQGETYAAIGRQVHRSRQRVHQLLNHLIPLKLDGS